MLWMLADKRGWPALWYRTASVDPTVVQIRRRHRHPYLLFLQRGGY